MCTRWTIIQENIAVPSVECIDLYIMYQYVTAIELLSNCVYTLSETSGLSLPPSTSRAKTRLCK